MFAGRVMTHVEAAHGWLARAAEDWRRGERGRTVLHLSLAEAEVRLARRLAEVEPLPERWRPSPTLGAVAAAVVAAVVLGAWVRWTGGPVAHRAPSQPVAATVSLEYVPGRLLELVAPPQGTFTLRPWVGSAVREETVRLNWLREHQGVPGSSPAVWPARVPP